MRLQNFALALVIFLADLSIVKKINVNAHFSIIISNLLVNNYTAVSTKSLRELNETNEFEQRPINFLNQTESSHLTTGVNNIFDKTTHYYHHTRSISGRIFELIFVDCKYTVIILL
jgi:hypothetical protein